VPKSIPHPEWWDSGIPNYPYVKRNNVQILDEKGIAAMRKVCRLSREVLDVAAAAIKPGVTTDYIDSVVHQACIDRDVRLPPTHYFMRLPPTDNPHQAYPSPLNYNHFPKSVCTSVNEVICHGIPDARPLVDGDIVNIDVSLFHGGYHGDLNETYYVGPLSSSDPNNVRLVETTRQCLDKAIAHVAPGVPIKDFGDIIEKHAKTQNLSVVKTYCGHGINTLFHGAPNVPHYAKNKAVGKCRAGMTFTIEPMISLGSYKDKTWPDDWTAVTVDGSRSAQFEHTLLVTEKGVEVLTARLEGSPGGPVEMPKVENVSNGEKKD
jgi:methionyl aminopeptidase